MKGLLTINQFANFSRTTMDALRHYDRIGLLSPVFRGENNYRYYSMSQLATVNVIHSLQELGMSLEEIKNVKDTRTPHSVDSFFARQIMEVDVRIEHWVRARKLLQTLRKTIASTMDVVPGKIVVDYVPAESIILGDLNDYSQGRNDYDALLTFYEDMQKIFPQLDLNYPVWGMFSQRRIMNKDFVWPDRYYFFNPDGHDRRPGGLYAIGHMHGGYGQSAKLYELMYEYIEEHKLEIAGDAYEEYPLNELCVVDESEYLMRVMIAVKES